MGSRRAVRCCARGRSLRSSSVYLLTRGDIHHTAQNACGTSWQPERAGRETGFVGSGSFPESVMSGWRRPAPRDPMANPSDTTRRRFLLASAAALGGVLLPAARARAQSAARIATTDLGGGLKLL